MNGENTSLRHIPLIDTIRRKRRLRTWIAIPLIILGLAGLILPLIPGLAVLFAGIVFLKPELAQSLGEKLSRFAKR